eukprot:1491041-Heterocapsa_arctica.AAC.1
MGIEQTTSVEHGFEAQNCSQAQILCTMISVLREYNGNGEDARRPFKNVQKRAKTFKVIYT